MIPANPGLIWVGLFMCCLFVGNTFVNEAEKVTETKGWLRFDHLCRIGNCAVAAYALYEVWP